MTHPELVAYIDIINGYLFKGNFKEINAMLRLPEDRLLARVALLRSTYTARQFLSSWCDYLNGTRDLCVQEGENPRKVLSGLYEWWYGDATF